MVLDKGLGWNAYTDLIDTAAPYIDFIKLGFGTAPLYPSELLLRKIRYAKQNNIVIMPGGTMLEVAVHMGLASSFFDTACALGFDGIEVSDGTIELDRGKRTSLIREGICRGMRVCSEFGKKDEEAVLDPYELAVTAEKDWEAGSELITIEARESGLGVGMFDSNGDCKEDTFAAIRRLLPTTDRVMWEAPLKAQQAYLIRAIGSGVHLGNIPPADVIALEAMRRGLRNDTFTHEQRLPVADYYMI